VAEYLDQLPPEQREVVSKVRDTILANLPEGYVETMNWGMISYEIPLEDYPDTYNNRPLSYAALAAQKRYYSLYLNSVYGDPEKEAELKEGFERAGRKLDMGKSCVRFRKLEQVPLDVIGDVMASTPPEEYIAIYEASRKKK
jgi:hypothetical protein